MKRLIKFYNTIGSKIEFSECSTRFEVLPYIVDDKAGPQALKALAKQLGLRTSGAALKSKEKGRLTHYVALTTHNVSTCYRNEKRREYLGFVPMPSDRGALDGAFSLTPGAALTKEQCSELVNMQACGIDDVGENVQGGVTLVKSGWNFETDLRLLGYSQDQFCELMGVTEVGFYDDTTRCDSCNKYNDNDDCYTSNFRCIDGGMLGIECGCYEEYAATPEALEAYAGNSDSAMEFDAAKTHADAGRLKFIERFIGGMTDRGRGGYWHGNGSEDYSQAGHVRNGSPNAVLAALKAANPKGSYILTHDESGQFQTYFSVWEVVKGPVSEKRRAKVKAALAATDLESRTA